MADPHTRLQPFGPLLPIGGRFLLSLQVVETEQPLLRVSFFFVILSLLRRLWLTIHLRPILLYICLLAIVPERWAPCFSPGSEDFRSQMNLHDGKHGPSEMPQWRLRRLTLPMMISGNMVDWVDGSETWRRV